jgi:hypothetical protein
MGSKKIYADADKYELKLDKVMERFNVTEYNFNWDRFGCWIEFRYKGELYRFEHSVEKAKSKGVDIRYGSDSFAQLVLALEDLARISERGIYDLQRWVEGMKFLPPAVEIPSFLQYLGFTTIPDNREEINDRYRSLAKQMHPDAGGNEEDFMKLRLSLEQSLKYIDSSRE